MASYDFSEYPEKSGVSQSIFIQRLINEGLKLYTLSEELLSYFCESISTRKIEIQMQYVTSTAENCLRRLSADCSNVYFPSREEWIKAIKDSEILSLKTYLKAVKLYRRTSNMYTWIKNWINLIESLWGIVNEFMYTKITINVINVRVIYLMMMILGKF